ncbi:MAG TPA: phosphodiester glycosidase family protein [Pyrinomonadaceae bacterium]|jgi:exopolysaccharide biosynthesis protein|nr:phosphodiester glycosidase family protein [Pyrinomonadaceae bacterium]
MTSAATAKIPIRNDFWRLASLLLLLVLFSGGSLTGVLGQSPSDTRYTASLKFQEIEPGIEYGQTTSGLASSDERTGPWLINVLRIDLARARLKVVHAMDEGVGLETVSSLAARYGAAAATNGGYFRTTGTFRGENVGLFVLDRQLISEPHKDRAEFGLIDVGDKTEVIFGHLKFSGEISVESLKRSVQGLNRPLSPDEIIIFTPQFHRTTLTNADGIEVVVQRNRVVAVNDRKGSSIIPADGFVISAVGKSRDWLKAKVRKGSQVKFAWRLNSIEPGEDKKWEGAHTILGGGPQLIKDGKIAITNTQEQITPAFVNDGHPRTAIAKLSSHQILLVTIDGRQRGEGIGMALTTLADLLLELGAVEAINLDGGGSTTMVIQNRIVNRPSDETGERPVSDAILVFPKSN